MREVARIAVLRFHISKYHIVSFSYYLHYKVHIRNDQKSFFFSKYAEQHDRTMKGKNHSTYMNRHVFIYKTDILATVNAKQNNTHLKGE